MGIGKEGTQFFCADTGIGSTHQFVGHVAASGFVAGPFVAAGATDVVQIFGDVGQMREHAEGPNDVNGIGWFKQAQSFFQLLFCRFIVIAMVAHRHLPDHFDDFKSGLAVLLAHCIAQNTPQQTDVIAQWCVFVLIFDMLRHEIPEAVEVRLAALSKPL